MNKRIFIAIKINPTKELLRRIYYLKRNLVEENINWIKEDHFHLTLRFIGETSADKIETIGNILENEFTVFNSFDLDVLGISLFGSKHSPRVIWADVEPKNKIHEMAHAINQNLIPLGFEADRQNFVPHLTIARIRKLKNKKHFHNVIDRLDNEIIQTERINTVILFESNLKRTGAVYNILKEVKLKS